MLRYHILCGYITVNYPKEYGFIVQAYYTFLSKVECYIKKWNTSI